MGLISHTSNNREFERFISQRTGTWLNYFFFFLRLKVGVDEEKKNKQKKTAGEDLQDHLLGRLRDTRRKDGGGKISWLKMAAFL